jgi:biofilm protein TabA
MRFIANTKTNNLKIKRLMIYDCEDGAYLFEYDILKDGPSLRDYCYEDLETAFKSCEEDYGVGRDDWKQIPEPHEDCQQDDWIEPVRVIGRKSGQPQWGRFEKLVNGRWVEINET